MAGRTLFWLSILLFFSVTSSSVVRRHAPAPCVYDCHCSTNHTTKIMTYHCKSLDFVSKLSIKESGHIISLDVSNTSQKSFDKRLKKLVNLERLNLANNEITDLKHFPHLPKLTHLNLRANHIKSFSAKNLPNTLRSLDVSHNYIRELPQDITKLHHLKHVSIFGNSFSCNRESLDTRDSLLENEVKIVGHATCDEPEKFKGQSWFHVVDLDEYFKIQDQEGMQADEPEGSGDGSGWGELIIKNPESPVTEEPIVQQKAKVQEATKAPSTEKPEKTTQNDIYFEGSGDLDSGINVRGDKGVDPNDEKILGQPEDKNANLGTNIFLGVFLLCLVALLIYAIKKNKEKKREARRKKRLEKLKQKAAIELMPKNTQKPSDKQNGNSEAVPLMNGQNGNSKGDAADAPKDAESIELLENDADDNGELLRPGSAPLLGNPNVKAVKVIAAEIPESVPQTPILVSRSRSSDGNLVVTPKATQRNS